MNKHTAGPWTIDGSFIRRLPDDDELRGDLVASVVESPRDGGGIEAEANAALIAAAPDLLEAMEALFEHCAMVHSKWGDGCNREQANAAQQAARAAIAKARGDERP